MRNFLLGVASAILAGCVVAIFNLYLSTPEQAKIEVTYEYIRASNPAYIFSEEDAKELNAFLMKRGIDFPIADLMLKFRRAATLDICAIHIKNSGEIRSKKIEVSAPNAVYLAQYSEKVSAKVSDSTYQIDSLNPGKTVDIVVVTRSYYSAPSFTVLHDGKRIRSTSFTYNEHDDLTGFDSIVYSFPAPIIIFAAIGVLVALLLVAAGIFSLIFGSGIPQQAKLMSAKSAKQFSQVIDYIREHYPEKLK